MTERLRTTAGARSGRRDRMRVLAAAVLGAALTLFAVLNSQTVRVHRIVTATDVPMIVMIVACGLIGAAVASLLGRRRRRRTPSARG